METTFNLSIRQEYSMDLKSTVDIIVLSLSKGPVVVVQDEDGKAKRGIDIGQGEHKESVAQIVRDNDNQLEQLETALVTLAKKVREFREE